jgi:tetratricopeptide (TPR) repeat protein
MASIALCGALGMSIPLHASKIPAMDAELGEIDLDWATIKYLVPDQAEQLKRFDALAQKTARIVEKYPDRAEPLLWEGVVTYEESRLGGVLREHRLTESARSLFKRAEDIDPRILHGAVILYLGIVYYQEPGFPLGFGDDKKASHYLQLANDMNPEGLDAAYFYGAFLRDKGNNVEATIVLARALESPPDPDRPVWDAGRRAEIKAILAKIGR